MLKRLYTTLKAQKDAQETAPTRRKIRFETLEPRILLSADLGIDIHPQETQAPPATEQVSAFSCSPLEQQDSEALAPGGLTNEVTAPLPQTNQPRQELVIIDTSLTAPELLIEQICSNDQTSYSIELIESSKDGLTQLSEILQRYDNLDAIHILSHGDRGSLRLGSSVLENGTLDGRRADLENLKASIGEDGDILLYGCNIAQDLSLIHI